MLSSFWKYLNPPGNYPPSVMIPHFEPLEQWLPEDRGTGYLLDGENTDPQTCDLDARFYLAQYTLSPRIIWRMTACPLVIVDGDQSKTPPKIAKQQGWTLVADLHNGVRLYRTQRMIP